MIDSRVMIYSISAKFIAHNKIHDSRCPKPTSVVHTLRVLASYPGPGTSLKTDQLILIVVSINFCSSREFLKSVVLHMRDQVCP